MFELQKGKKLRWLVRAMWILLQKKNANSCSHGCMHRTLGMHSVHMSQKTSSPPGPAVLVGRGLFGL
jgi:hypothetical protein